MTRISHTDYAVAEHLSALPHMRYEVGIYDAEAEKMALRRWDGDGIARALPYLKAQNAQGRNVYVRPQGQHPYSLIDDLTPAAFKAMTDAGFRAALVVETSPDNLQAWIHHGRVLDERTSTAVSKELASRFGGDPSSADWRHFGRLAGFTNRKPKHRQDNGQFPFVRVIEATGQINPKSPDLIANVVAQLAERDRQAAELRAHVSQAPASELRKSIEDFRTSSAYGGDQHRADLAYATYAISRGASDAQVDQALRSRDLTHKGSPARQRDYVERTIEKARQAAQQHSR